MGYELRWVDVSPIIKISSRIWKDLKKRGEFDTRLKYIIKIFMKFNNRNGMNFSFEK